MDEAEKPIEPTELELLQRCREGETEAFTELVDRHQQTLMNFLRSMGVSPSELDDIAQEVWIKVYDYRKKYRANARFTTFLYTMAKNKVIDTYRKRKRWDSFRRLFRLEMDHAEEQRLRKKEQGEDGSPDTEALLLSLPAAQREVVILRTRENLPYQEIAELLNIPLGTVKSRMHQGIKSLKELAHG